MLFCGGKCTGLKELIKTFPNIVESQANSTKIFSFITSLLPTKYIHLSFSQANFFQHAAFY